MVSTDLEQFTGLLDVQTGELLPATVDNAARVIQSARVMKARVNEIVNEATQYLAEVAAVQGTKTLHGDGETVTITGGASIDYDPVALLKELETVGCPPSRIDQAVFPEVTYKVNRAVLRQLAGANPEYRAAIARCELEVEKPWRASVKLRRNSEHD